MIQQIHQQLLNTSRNHPSKFMDEYRTIEDDYFDWFTNNRGVKTDLLLNQDYTSTLNWLRFTYLFSDYTSILPQNRNDLSFYHLKKNLRSRLRVKMPSKMLKEISDTNMVLNPMYAHITNKQLKNLMNNISPIVRKGKATYRPSRVYLGQNNVSTPTTNNSINKLYFVDPGSPVDYWIFKDANEAKQKSIPITNEIPYFRGFEKEVFTMSLPFIDGISFEEMDELLTSEGDYISNLRMKMKELIDRVQEVENYNFNDISTFEVQPSIDEINRRFREIKQNHRLRVTGLTIGVATLMLCAFPLGLSELLSQIGFTMGAGIGGRGFVRLEEEYRNEVEELRNKDFYLFWRLAQISKNRE